MAAFIRSTGKSRRIALITGPVIAAAALLVVFFTTIGGNKAPVYSVGNGVFSISSMYGQSVNLSDIRSVQLKTTVPSNLRRVNGYGFGSIVKGKCTSDIGDVTVYIDTSKPPFLYVTTASGLIVLNCQSAEDTQSLYDQLNSALNP